MAAPEIPASTKSDVKEFVRLDDGLKEARSQTKVARKELEECRERIITYMRTAGIGRLGIKKGTQFLEAKEKTLKVRPHADVVKAKLQELISKSVTNPDEIYKAIQECGGTKKVWKLSRRSKRKPSAKKKKKKKSDEVVEEAESSEK